MVGAAALATCSCCCFPGRSHGKECACSIAACCGERSSSCHASLPSDARRLDCFGGVAGVTGPPPAAADNDADVASAAALAAASADRRRALRVVTPGDGVAAAAFEDAAVEAVGEPVGCSSWIESVPQCLLKCKWHSFICHASDDGSQVQFYRQPERFRSFACRAAFQAAGRLGPLRRLEPAAHAGAAAAGARPSIRSVRGAKPALQPLRNVLQALCCSWLRVCGHDNYVHISLL